MVSFYKTIPGLDFLEWKYDTENQKRSGWFQTSQGTLLMIEKRTYNKAPEALVFEYRESLSEEFLISDSTDYTIYVIDPDGNRLGFSSYPKPFKKQV